MILIHGSVADTQTLGSYCQRELSGLRSAVLTPKCLQTVEVLLPPSYRLAVSDTVLASLNMHGVKGHDMDYSLAWATGTLMPHLLSPFEVKEVGRFRRSWPYYA